MGAVLQPTSEMGDWCVEVRRESAYLNGPDPISTGPVVSRDPEMLGFAIRESERPRVIAALEQILEHPAYDRWVRSHPAFTRGRPWSVELVDGWLRISGPAIVSPRDDTPWTEGAVELEYQYVGVLRDSLVTDTYISVQDLVPGQRIQHPLGREPWVLDVVSVDPPDDQGIVTLHALQETVRFAVDWPLLPYTGPATNLQTIVELVAPVKGLCPNVWITPRPESEADTPRCSHPGYLHDIEDEGDPIPMCGVNGCRCGHPPAGWRRALPMRVWRDGETVPAGQAVMDLAGRLQPPDLDVNGREWVNTRGPVVAIERTEG